MSSQYVSIARFGNAFCAIRIDSRKKEVLSTLVNQRTAETFASNFAEDTGLTYQSEPITFKKPIFTIAEDENGLWRIVKLYPDKIDIVSGHKFLSYSTNMTFTQKRAEKIAQILARSSKTDYFAILAIRQSMIAKSVHGK